MSACRGRPEQIDSQDDAGGGSSLVAWPGRASSGDRDQYVKKSTRLRIGQEEGLRPEPNRTDAMGSGRLGHCAGI